MCGGVEQRVRVAARAAIFGLLAILLGSCSGIDRALDKALSAGDTGDASDAVIHADLTAHNPAGVDNRLRDPATPAGQIYAGAAGADTDNLARIANPPPAAPGEEAVPRGADSYDLNFQNADINAVTKVRSRFVSPPPR